MKEYQPLRWTFSCGDIVAENTAGLMVQDDNDPDSAPEVALFFIGPSEDNVELRTLCDDLMKSPEFFCTVEAAMREAEKLNRAHWDQANLTN